MASAGGRNAEAADLRLKVSSTAHPRAVRPEEFESLMTLVNDVFAHGRPPMMGQSYPHLFTPDNFENLRVVREGDRIVSHVGTTIRDAVILGCSVRVANVGAVSTAPDCRGRGYAAACFNDACANAHAQGVDFMLISGDRNLYRLSGCRRVGLDRVFTVRPGGATMPVSPDVRIRSFQQGDLLTLKRLYENEPVRFLRPREDWERFLRNGKSTQHGSEVWLILRGESVVAYAALNPRGSEMVELEEFAGDRAALVASLRLLMNEAHIPGVQLHTPSWDTALVALLSGASARPTHSSGTQLVVNFTQFMERLRPHMRERAGTAQERRLSFREYEGRFVFGVDGETVVSTTRGGAAQFIWGSREALEWEWSGGMEARSILEAIFPIPALNYGFSYV